MTVTASEAPWLADDDCVPELLAEPDALVDTKALTEGDTLMDGDDDAVGSWLADSDCEFVESCEKDGVWLRLGVAEFVELDDAT